jgi:hypothetical protein
LHENVTRVWINMRVARAELLPEYGRWYATSSGMYRQWGILYTLLNSLLLKKDIYFKIRFWGFYFR